MRHALALLCLATASRVTADNRPAPADRKFRSPAVDGVVADVAGRMKDKDLAALFTNCLPNTLDTTVAHAGRNDTFVITGDIAAMWLRDSSGQVTPYIPYLAQDPQLRDMLLGLLERQFASVLLDVYANSFNYGADGSPWQRDDRHPAMQPRVFEGKYELDSWAYVMENAYKIYTRAGLEEVSAKYAPAMLRIYNAMRYMQQDTRDMKENDEYYYRFQRTTSAPTDSLVNKVGPPGLRCGLVRSAFRPSDDATRLPYLIPSNAFAVVALRHTAELFTDALGDAANAAKFTALADEMDAAIQAHAVVASPLDASKKIYAFEVDCSGSQVIMDDANVPNLVSLPYLGYLDAADPVYQATRDVVYSNTNAYYTHGAHSAGVGSPHTGQLRIWPLSHIFRAITSSDKDEIATCLEELKYASAGTGFVHEAYAVDNPRDFSRSWFAWANSMFGFMILQVADAFPELLF